MSLIDTYWTDARRIMTSLNYGFLVRNDDIVSDVASAIMQADHTWDGVSSSKETWRFNQARYALLHIIAKNKRQRKHKSLDCVVGNQELSLNETIADKSNIHDDKVRDIVDCAKTVLTDKQFVVFQLYYQDGCTLDEIGKKFNLTRAAISLQLKKIIGKIKNEYI